MTKEMQAEGMAFSAEENEQITRVGPGTLMGGLFRQYWIPVLPQSFLDEPGGRPRRIRLLGEDLVLFRTRRGEVGLVGAYCSHRLAPLYFGRIEDDGIRCPYHGWKYSPVGKCLEMPNVPPEQQFADLINHPGYPCVEHGGVIWTYMGPSRELPPLPEFEFTMVPPEQRSFRPFLQECNYLQALEGGIDPTHVMWLHSPYDLADEEISRLHQPAQQIFASKSGARTPQAIEFVDTPAGFMYGARRPMGDDKTLWRVNQFLLPFYTMPPGGDMREGRMWVPVDDENCVKWYFRWFPTRAIMEKTKEKPRFYPEEEYVLDDTRPYGFIRPKASRANDYLINWEIHKTRRLGISGVNLQDKCCQENEGPTPILDRTKENLCSGDLSIIKARRILLRAARELSESGKIPPGVRNPEAYRLRAVSMVLPNDVNWVEGVREEVTVGARAA
ncbi:MAG TPA: Rieske 2Fe-2S domain-containing protein [Candidatus Acidoferrales bacterium]|nr:Rieske 2Fe-2S domain-containing protein [Candidatus Acidoferrales bacterium]